MTVDPKEEYKAQVQPQAGGSGKPPKPTAVGSGDSDDDDYYSRRAYNFDLDAPPKAIPAWPLPDLIFHRVNMPDAADYDLASALPELHKAGANIAHLIVSGADQLFRAVGITESAIEGLPRRAPLERNEIEALIKPLSRCVGTVTGIPTNSAAADGLPPIESLLTKLTGDKFGLLTLAAPIPQARFELEEEALMAVIEQAKLDDNPETKGRSRYRMESDLLLLERLRSGAAHGLWQHCTYFFAADRGPFVRLSTVIIAALGDSTIKPTITCHVDNGLTSLLELLAMPLSRWSDQQLPSLDTYKHLTPLSCDQIALLCSRPKQKE